MKSNLNTCSTRSAHTKNVKKCGATTWSKCLFRLPPPPRPSFLPSMHSYALSDPNLSITRTHADARTYPPFPQHFVRVDMLHHDAVACLCTVVVASAIFGCVAANAVKVKASAEDMDATMMKVTPTTTTTTTTTTISNPRPLRISTVFVDGHDLQRAVFVDSPSPTFSWELDCRPNFSPDSAPSVVAACPRGTVQTAHQLQIFSAKRLVVDWGVINSPVPSFALPQGLGSLLKASTKYTYELRVWTTSAGKFQEFQESGVRAAAHAATARGQFNTALFSPSSEWSAEWISGGTMLRSSPFSARNSTMVSASLFASGIGCFSLTINGVHVDTSYVTSPPQPLRFFCESEYNDGGHRPIITLSSR